MSYTIEDGILEWEGMRFREVSEEEIMDFWNWGSRFAFSKSEDGEVSGIAIADTELNSFPTFANDFSGIKYLRLSSCSLKSLDGIQALDSIQNLDLSHNQIVDISPIKNLSNIQTLWLFGNQFDDISPIKNLTNIQTLWLSGKKIFDISPIQNLTNIQTLYLLGNQIVDISPIRNSTNIQTLCLLGNQIVDISPIQKLTNIQSLWLSDNQIADIQQIRQLLQLPKLEHLNLAKNPLPTIPKEIIGDGYDNCLPALSQYFADLDKGISYSREVKIILIGNGNVGKTQIAKRLAEQEKFVFNAQHNSTHAIALLRRKLASKEIPAGLDLHIWDFAGQDLYHATHRIFMQTRALFVLVWDAENEAAESHNWEGKTYQNEKLIYWLKYVKHFGEGSPVLLVRNKMDRDVEGEEILLEGEVESWEKEYRVLESIAVSAETGENFDVLEYWIERIFTTESDLRSALIEVEIPASWILVRNQISDLQKDGRIRLMPFDEFQGLCTEAKIPDSAQVLAEFLHNSGVIFYRKNYFQNHIIVDQGWVMEAIYKVLDRQSLLFRANRIKNGILNYELICEVWPEHSDDERKLFMDFMISCELALHIDMVHWNTPFEGRRFLIPQLLQANMPNDAKSWRDNPKHSLTHSIEFEFLPSSFVHRLIMRGYHLNYLGKIWQTGILLTYQSTYAIVYADLAANTLHIRATQDATELVKRILDDIEELKGERKINPIDKSPDGEISRQHPFFRGMAGLSNTGREKGTPDLLREWIRELEWDQVFEHLEKCKMDDPMRESVLGLHLRYSAMKQDHNSGVLSLDERNLERNKIGKALFQLVNTVYT